MANYPKATEANASSTLPGQDTEHVWVLVTQRGPYKFVRVEQAPPEDANANAEVSLYRGAEVFVWAQPGIDADDLDGILPDDRYYILGTNSRKGCFLVQFRNVSPEGLPAALLDLATRSVIAKIEPCPIE